MKKLLLFTAVAAAAICLTAVRAQIPANQKLRLAEAAISQFYVDTVNEDALVEAGIKSMLKELDPHSSYSNAEETKELNEPLNGNFSGIGITFNMKLTFCARLSLYLYFTYIKRLGPGLTSDKESMSCIRLRLWLQLRRRMRAMSF